MKIPPAIFRLGLIAVLSAWPALRAADSKPEATQNHNPRNGYTVTLDVKIDEQGKPEGVSVVSTDDDNQGEIISKMAIVMAMKTTFPPRLKDGVAHKYTARAPFFFPIEDDEGPAAEALPKPKKVMKGVPIDYPSELRTKGVVGGVIFELIVDENGKVSQLKTLRASHPEFEKVARESVAKWEFAPAEKDGHAVESRFRIAIVFETPEEMADLKWRIPPRPKLGSYRVLPLTNEQAAAAGMIEGGKGESAPSAPTEAPKSETPPAVPPEPGK
jgi:TonB family protein